MENWYALRVKPHKETAVCQLLTTQAVPLYFPTIKVKPVNPRSAKVKPYFPGYLFLQADLDKVGQNAFNWLPGTLGLVSFGNVPATVPQSLIEKLKQELEKLSQIQTRRLDFKQGERVHIHEGPFTGFEAIFDKQLPGSERVQILLAFLSSHPHPIRLSQEAIEKI